MSIQESLCYAAQAGDEKEVRSLLEQGVDPDSRMPDGMTALAQSVYWSRNPRVVKLLIEAGAEVNATNGAGIPVISLAAERGNSEAVRLLVEAGADKNAADTEGSTPLMYATASSGLPESIQEEIVRLLQAD